MEGGREAGTRLRVAPERPTEDGERPKRSRRCAEPTSSPAMREELGAAVSPRPTDAAAVISVLRRQLRDEEIASLERQLAMSRAKLESIRADLREIDSMESRLEACSAMPESQESEHASDSAVEHDVAAVPMGMC